MAQAQALQEAVFGDPPHEGKDGGIGQVHIVASFLTYPVTVVACGRQFGKSSLRRYIYGECQSRTPGFCVGAYMAQGHSQAQSAFEKDLFDFQKAKWVVGYKNEDQYRYIDIRPIQLQMPDGSLFPNDGLRVWYWSGDPMAHRKAQGETLNFAILDECSHLPKEAWIETIVPMFNATGGHAVLLGTPIPEGIGWEWFESEWNKGNPLNDGKTDDEGKPKRDPNYRSWNAKSEANPFGKKETIALGRSACSSKAMERCLYDGEFSADFGAVFINLEETCILRPKVFEPGWWMLRDPDAYEEIVVGIDWGRHEDSTCLVAMSRRTMEMIGLLTMKGEYLPNQARVHRFISWAKATQVWCEARNEEALVEMMRERYGTRLIPVKWASGGVFDKEKCVTNGMDYFHRKAWRLFDLPYLRDELRMFQREKREKSGKWEYGAASGAHDDAVVALLYTTYGLPTVAECEARKQESPMVKPYESLTPWMMTKTTYRRNPYSLRR